MIVECDHCNTKFNLPDEKLKPGGVKIRCTRCKEIFKVPGPEAADDDLSGFEGGDDFSTDTGEDSGIDDGFGLDEGSDDFSGGDSPSDDGFSLDDDSSDDGFGLDEGSDDLTGGDLPSDDDFSLDDDSSDDGFGLDEGSDSLTGGDSPSDDGFSLDDDSSGGGLGLDEGSDDLSLDDSSEFDISSFDDDGDTTIGEDPSGLDFSSPLGDEGGGGLGLDIGKASFEDGGMEPTEGFAPAKMKKSRRSPLVVALLIILVIVAGAYFAFKSLGGGIISIDYINSLLAGNEDPLEGLEIVDESLNHYYANNEAGTILVVEGMVLNSSKVAKGQIKVRIKLYDSKEKVIEDYGTEVYCGNILKKDTIETSSKEEIIKSLNTTNSADNPNARVVSGNQIGFTLVIFDIPPDSNSFKIEIIEAENVG